MVTNASEKSVVFIADLHCGSRVAVTDKPSNSIQKALLKAWRDSIERLGSPDILVVNGDLIDGPDKKNGGRDLTEPNLVQQALSATALISEWKAKEIFVIAGTPYHVGDDVDFEEFVADKLGASFHNKLVLSVNGYTFDVRHKIGASNIQHGRFTASARERGWDAINAAIKQSDHANMIVRSHVHYWTYNEDALGGALTTPCWQAPGSIYGARQCTGRIDIGAVKFTVGSKGDAQWQRLLFPLSAGHAPRVKR